MSGKRAVTKEREGIHMEKKVFAGRRLAVMGIMIMLAGCLGSSCGSNPAENPAGGNAGQTGGESTGSRMRTEADSREMDGERNGEAELAGGNTAGSKDGKISGEEMDWKDERVKEAVYSALGYRDGEMPAETEMREEIEALEWLQIADAQEVETFKDLAYLPELKALSLSYGGSEKVTIDLDKAMAPELEELEIRGCDLDGNELLGRLSEFPKLTNLYLTGCGLRDISFLEGLPQLTRLSFYGNEITDLSPMESCKELVEISLAYNKIMDIRAINKLEKLEELGIHGNEISSIEPLRGLRNLKEINVTSNRISDLSPLEDSIRLEALGAGDNQIADISPLKKLTRLYNLALDYNEIEDISALEHMEEMSWLGLSNNRIQDFTPIMGMEKLFFLSVFDNPGRDVGELAFCVPELYLGTAETENCTFEKKKELEKAQELLDGEYPGDGIVAEDAAFGDLDGDGIEDIAITGVSEADEEEKETMDFGDTYRNVYVFLRTGQDTFSRVPPVETLSSWMGGIYGDPYQGISISCGKLVVETYGGSNWRWGFRNVYAYEGGLMKEKMEAELEHFVYTDGYDWSVRDCETGEWKDYVITGGVEERMKKLLVAESADPEKVKSFMGECGEVLEEIEKEKGITLPSVEFYDCLPDIETRGEPYGYIALETLCNTREKTAPLMEKAAEEFLEDAAALPVAAYTSEEIKGSYDALTGVSVPEVFYIGWADGEAVRLSYKSLLRDREGEFIHEIAWEEPDEERERWVETAVVYFEEGTGVFRKDVFREISD